MLEEEGDGALVLVETAVWVALDTPVVAADAEGARLDLLAIGQHLADSRVPVDPEEVGAGRLRRRDG